jgi:hypothetical protein
MSSEEPELLTLAQHASRHRREALEALYVAIQSDRHSNVAEKLATEFSAIQDFAISLPKATVQQQCAEIVTAEPNDQRRSSESLQRTFWRRRKLLRYGLDGLELNDWQITRFNRELLTDFNQWLVPYIAHIHQLEYEEPCLIPVFDDTVMASIDRALSCQRESRLCINQIFSHLACLANDRHSLLEPERLGGLYFLVSRRIDSFPDTHTSFLAWLKRVAMNHDTSEYRVVKNNPFGIVLSQLQNDEKKRFEPNENQLPHRHGGPDRLGPDELAAENEFLAALGEPFSEPDWQRICQWAQQATLVPVVILIGTGWFQKVAPGSDCQAKASQRSDLEKWMVELGVQREDLTQFWKELSDAKDFANVRLEVLNSYSRSLRGNHAQRTYFRAFSGTSQMVRQASFGKFHLVVHLDFYWKFYSPQLLPNESCVVKSMPVDLDALCLQWTTVSWNLAGRDHWESLIRDRRLSSCPPWLETLRNDRYLEAKENDVDGQPTNADRLGLKHPNWTSAAQRVRLALLAHGRTGNLEAALRVAGASWDDTSAQDWKVQLKKLVEDIAQ